MLPDRSCEFQSILEHLNMMVGKRGRCDDRGYPVLAMEVIGLREWSDDGEWVPLEKASSNTVSESTSNRSISEYSGDDLVWTILTLVDGSDVLYHGIFSSVALPGV